MFYQTPPSTALRFGDVLQGFVSATPVINDPANVSPTLPFTIEIHRPIFSVVLSPCCSIADKVILLAPLVRLRAGFYNNPYFVDDMTRINRVMNPEQAVPPGAWANMSAEEKARRHGVGSCYTLVELFVYQAHDLFPEYSLDRKDGNIKTNLYMIDFLNTSRLNCEKIVSPNNSPIATKRLELTVDARTQLRDKISQFYGRVPVEDKVAA